MGKAVSIITEDLTRCEVCGRPATDIHHCIHGTAGRKLADKYHLIIGLCNEHHRELHDSNNKMDRHFQQMAQIAFQAHYPSLNFKEIFGRNYL